YGKVAPAAFRFCACVLAVARRSSAAKPSMLRSFIVPLFGLPLEVVAKMPFRLLQSRSGRSGARQGVTEVDESQFEACTARRARGDRPRVAHDVRELAHKIQGAILRIAPEGLIEPDRGFLDRAVLRYGG